MTQSPDTISKEVHCCGNRVYQASACQLESFIRSARELICSAEVNILAVLKLAMVQAG
jgi:hypothetical protein